MGFYLMVVGIGLMCIAIYIKVSKIANSIKGTRFTSTNISSDAISQQYYELLWAVEQKQPGESRHEAALRCIRLCESSSDCGVAKQHTC